MKLPKVSIAIPTFNEERDIEDCLKSIFKQDYPKYLIEVLIVDDGSQDKTLDIVKKYNVRVLRNGYKDAEVGKMIGFRNATGELFMYLDADMRFVERDWLKRTVHPFLDDEEIVGSVATFKVNKNDPPLNRCLSYDLLQRDPIFRFFTPNIIDVIVEKRKGYFLCSYEKKIVPQSLMLYRKKIVEPYLEGKKQLIDNDIPAIFVKKGYTKFAYAPSVGVYHILARSLMELAKKRVRNIKRTYLPNIKEREYRWFSLKKDFLKILFWVIYTHLLIPPFFVGVYNSIKNKDMACLNEPIINLVSTDAIIYALLF